jgi:hypothetical protein
MEDSRESSTPADRSHDAAGDTSLLARPSPGAENSGAVPEPCRAPVLVLTTSRSGSTLLRFILDSHPDLACPPETSFAAAGGLLARTLDILENAGSDSKVVTGPWQPSAMTLSTVRETIDRVYGQYLQRRGKPRWCDKSLDTYQFAELITQLYPDAKFICLYRHCMDVIASGIEACPLGVTRFGFDPYVSRTPGNNVAAIGTYWLETVQAIMAFEQQHPESCHRVRYEDLATAPEETATAIFSFLGARQVPGITQSCFVTPHEENGPGDEKIWFTKGVTAGSLGRGTRILADALPPPVRQAVNETLAKLDYRIVDDGWNSSADRIDPRAGTGTAVAAAANGHSSRARSAVDAAARAIADRMSAADGELAEIRSRWPGLAGQTVGIVILGANGEQRELHWTFSGTNGTPGHTDTPRYTGTEQQADAGEPVATLIAPPATWESLLAGQANLVTEITTGRLRCVNRRDKHRVRSDEMHAAATLLGLYQVPAASAPAIADAHGANAYGG